MPTYLVRVWMPDRPGALGAVASRIGAVRGDLVGIDILERGGGRAIDESAVELPDPELVALLTREIHQVDGVDVEDVRQAAGGLVDPRLDALETAGRLVSRGDVDGLLNALAIHSARDLEAEWAAVVDLGGRGSGADGQPDGVSASIVTGVGPVPEAAWLSAFVSGSRSSVTPRTAELGPDDIAWADLGSASLVLVLGRRGAAQNSAGEKASAGADASAPSRLLPPEGRAKGAATTASNSRPFRTRERRQLSALAQIADHRWVELAGKPLLH